jgi:cytochrome c oxidase subunit IV
MSHHVVPVRVYVTVFVGLLVLTFTTVAVSKVELGEFNFVVAITIAVIKASLVVWFFMHLNQSTSMTKLFAGAGIFWLGILLAFVFSDYVSRGWLPRASWWH